jgi:hypothetical protein
MKRLTQKLYEMENKKTKWLMHYKQVRKFREKLKPAIDYFTKESVYRLDFLTEEIFIEPL